MESSLASSNHRHMLSSTGVWSPGLNDTIDTKHINIPPDDTSVCAKITRLVLSCTSRIFTPRQVLVMIQTLRTLTFAVLIFTVIADLMYIFFVTLVASDEVNAKVGGTRDAMIRVYGLAMTIMALMIEFDVKGFLKYFSGLRGYIPRSLLLLFIAVITSPNPIHAQSAFNRDNDIDDDKFDDYYAEDGEYDAQVSAEIPGSTVRFQMVISFLLIICALTYFILGLFCCDRLSARAFVSEKDPVKATEIPQPQTPSRTGMDAIPSHVNPDLYTQME